MLSRKDAKKRIKKKEKRKKKKNKPQITQIITDFFNHQGTKAIREEQS